MFHSESLARAIHADRVREIERATRDHRLLAAAEIPEETAPPARIPRSPATCRPAARDGSTGFAA
jgi:hypothetical protein